MIAGIGSLYYRTWILRRFAVFFDVNCQLPQSPPYAWHSSKTLREGIQTQKKNIGRGISRLS